MTGLDWSIVLVLNGAIIAYGLYLARGTQTSSELFLGSRNLPWWAVGMSMFATNVDNADLVGVTGVTYSEGLHILSVYAIGSAVGGILAAFFVVPSIYRAGFYTNAEYLEARFGATARAVSALIQIQYRTSMLGVMINSAHLLLVGLVKMPSLTAWGLILILVVLAGLYTAWGGLRSVVWTDLLQGLVMIAAALVIFGTIWNVAGGWTGMSAALTQQGEADLLHIGRFRGAQQETHPLLVVFGWTVIGAGYWTVNHTQTMRLMGSRSIWDMKLAAVWGVGISMPILIVSALLGVFARAIPQMRGLERADSAYPLLAETYLTVGMKGLVVAGLVAAVVSTIDSMGSALSALFTRDVYARFLVKNQNDQHYVLVGRWATVGVFILGFSYLPFIWRQETMLKAFTTLVPVFVTPLFTMYLLGVLTPVHRRSGLLGLFVGSTYGVIALVDRAFWPVDWIPVWLSSQWWALLWSMLLTALIMGLLTCLWGRHQGDESTWQEGHGWLQRSRETLPPLKEHPFAGSIPWYADPRWAAIGLLLLSGYVNFVLFW